MMAAEPIEGKGRRFAAVPLRAATARLSARAHQVLIVLASHANKQGHAWPSMATIAAEAGIDRCRVPAAVRKLETAGLLTKHRRTDGRSNLYRVVFDDAGDTQRAGLAATQRG